MRRPQFHCKTHSEITDVMFELLSLIIIERGGEDKRTLGLGGFEAARGKALEPWRSRQDKSHLCDRKRKGREKNSGRYSRTERNGETEAE